MLGTEYTEYYFNTETNTEYINILKQYENINSMMNYWVLVLSVVDGKIIKSIDSIELHAYWGKQRFKKQEIEYRI